MRVGAARIVVVGTVLLLFSPNLWAGADDVPLLEAVKRQDLPAVRALLRENVDVNAPQPDGATALHWAVHLDDAEIVDHLIRAGAQVDAANEYGVTPLSLACGTAARHSWREC